jgi:hypothetical protein
MKIADRETIVGLKDSRQLVDVGDANVYHRPKQRLQKGKK